MRTSLLLGLLVVSVLSPGRSAFAAIESSIETAQADPEANVTSSDYKWDYNAPGVFTQLGLQLGPNATNATYAANNPVDDVSGRTRMMFGLNTTMGLGSALGGAFYLQPELNYVQRGFEQSVTLGSTRRNAELDVNYFEIPVLLKVKPNLNIEGIRPYLVFGPSAAFKLSSGGRLTESDATGRTTVASANASNWEFNSVLLSLNAGLGTEFALNEAVALTVGLRYNASLTNMLSNNEFSTQPDATLSQNAVQALAGVQIAL